MNSKNVVKCAASELQHQLGIWEELGELDCEAAAQKILEAAAHDVGELIARVAELEAELSDERLGARADISELEAALEARVEVLNAQAQQFEAERDYAIDKWVHLENKYEPSRHNAEEPWTHGEMLAEIHSKLGTAE